MENTELQKVQQNEEPVTDGQHHPGFQHGTALHIEMWIGKDTKFVTNTQSEKAKFNKMLQARIQGSSLLKSFQDSRSPMEKMKIWKFGR